MFGSLDTGRRGALKFGGGLLGALAAMPLGTTGARAASTPFDKSNSEDLLQAFIKLTATLQDDAEVVLHYKGVTFGVTDRIMLRPLYGMEGVIPGRVQKQPDGTWHYMLNEVGVFTDLATGTVLDRWHNPYLDQDVEVWHLRNGPMHLTLDPKKNGGNDFSRLSAGVVGQPSGFYLPIETVQDDFIVRVDSQADRKNPLDPATWKLESSGAQLHYSEHNTWFADRKLMEDRSLPSVPARAAWHSFKPWRPWMLMGERPGHIYSHLVTRKIAKWDGVSKPVLAWDEKNLPDFLSAPKVWTGTYKTDWDYFKEARKPA